MRYGERLKLAMDRRSEMLGQPVSRLEVAKIAGCSPQNIGMIINGTNGEDQRLAAVAHAKVAAFLRCNPDWLLDEVGTIEPQAAHLPSELSAAAVELGALFDMIPVSDRVARARAFNAASEAVMQVLHTLPATR